MPATKKGTSVSKAVAKRVPTPKPVVVEQVCDICDEDWAEHPENPTVMDCLEILKTKRVKLALKDLQGLHACCGHGHSCCYHWHVHYTYPYQATYTNPVWTTNGTATSPQLNITNNIMDANTARSLAETVTSIFA